MPRRTRTQAALQASRAVTVLAIRLGGDLRASRLRRGWTQAELARRAGIRQNRVSTLERGAGAGAPLRTWLALSRALERPLRVEFARDHAEEAVDAAHLELQELVMRLASAAGFRPSFEAPARPTDPAHSTDVAVRSDGLKTVLLVECWNRFADIGASVRSSDRKRADAERHLVATGRADDWRVHSCWVVRATRHNRELVERYPELFRSRFPGSSRHWARALTIGTAPPDEPGLVWTDPRASRIVEWRGGGARGACGAP